MTSLVVLSYIAGVLTVFVPCIWPLLPVVVGGSLTGTPDPKKPYIIIGSLTFSIVLFTVIIKLSADALGLSPQFWIYVSGVLVLLVGLVFLFPNVWHKIPGIGKAFTRSNALLGKGITKKGFFGNFIIGFSLAPAFTSCSPTYLLIVSAILPASLFLGIWYVLFYALGIGTVLLLIALLGQTFIEKFDFLITNKARRVVGLIIVITALLILTGYDKVLSTFVLDKVGFIDTASFEAQLIENTDF